MPRAGFEPMIPVFERFRQRGHWDWLLLDLFTMKGTNYEGLYYVVFFSLISLLFLSLRYKHLLLTWLSHL